MCCLGDDSLLCLCLLRRLDLLPQRGVCAFDVLGFDGVPGEVAEQIGLKLHAGPGTVKRTVMTPEGLRTVQEREARFIFDQDLFAMGHTRVPAVTETLERLHECADRVFSDAITDVLHDAMEAVEA